MRWIFLTGLLIALSACNLPQASLPPPTSTLEPVSAPGSSPTPGISPTPQPTPTPLPKARIGSGEKALFNGNYDLARQEYRAALETSAEDAIRREALWGQARVEFADGEYFAALGPLRQLTQTYPGSQEAIKAHFLLGEAYFNLARFADSAAAYQEYLTARPGLLDAYVQEKRGDALLNQGEYSGALSAYQAALTAPEQPDSLNIRIKIANTTYAAGEYDIALSMYDQIYAATDQDYLKARLSLLAGRALLQMNRQEEAYNRWQNAVDNYPRHIDSYYALVGLVEAEQPVNEFQRGLVDYFAEQYGVALAAFERYLAQNPSHDGTALHYKALTLREMGEFQAAFDLWNEFIQKYPDNEFWAAAWRERAYTQWVHLRQHIPAAESLETFAREVSASPSALHYLIEAARIYERGGELERSAALWESLPDRYPSDSRMAEAFFQAGILRYRLGDYPRANQNFQNALQLATSPSERARTLLWVGKTYQVSGDPENARQAWMQAQSLDTFDYYSIRARDLLEDRAPFAPPPLMKLDYDLTAGRKEAEAWLRIKFNLPAETDLSSPGQLGSDPRLRRGTELWQMGLYNLARLEFEALRQAAAADAADSFRLGNYLLDLGAYRSALFALRQVLTLAGLERHADSLNNAPAYFKYVRYGLYYSDLVWPAALENDLDPLFVTSMIRQESLFEGFVRSAAGARGLMQIIPATGASAAEQLGWPPNYDSEDLYSPRVSIRLGTHYLAVNRRLFNGDLSAALAAYNGGPGNAAAWQALANGDHDLFIEVIRFAETRNYIRSIYETYTLYRTLYGPNMDSDGLPSE